jgi:hypothetical protein
MESAVAGAPGEPDLSSCFSTEPSKITWVAPALYVATVSRIVDLEFLPPQKHANAFTVVNIRKALIPRE